DPGGEQQSDQERSRDLARCFAPGKARQKHVPAVVPLEPDSSGMIANSKEDLTFRLGAQLAGEIRRKNISAEFTAVRIHQRGMHPGVEPQSLKVSVQLAGPSAFVRFDGEASAG